MRAHRNDCGRFWTWAAVGAGLVLSFIGIFSVGPFLIPFVTLLLGVAATRRPHLLTILVVVPLALIAFVLVVGGRLHAEVAGAVTGAGLAAVLLGGPPACLLLVAAGLAAFPLLRAPSGPQPHVR